MKQLNYFSWQVSELSFYFARWRNFWFCVSNILKFQYFKQIPKVFKSLVDSLGHESHFDKYDKHLKSHIGAAYLPRLKEKNA